MHANAVGLTLAGRQENSYVTHITSNATFGQDR